MSFAQSVINATDNLAREPIRYKGLLFFPIAPWFLVAAHQSILTIAIAALFSLCALIFVSWRFWIVMKAAASDSDRQYDREDKYRLASEYHGTESSTAARERKRRG